MRCSQSKHSAHLGLSANRKGTVKPYDEQSLLRDSDCCAARPARLTLAVRGGALERRGREQGYKYRTFTNFFKVLRGAGSQARERKP
jgi:hypothetical protein